MQHRLARLFGALVALAGLATPALIVSARPAAAAQGTFQVDGGGFGHGVGMSQYGAYGMAVKGATADEILKHYYTGTVLGSKDLPANRPFVRVKVANPPASSGITIVPTGNLNLRTGTNPPFAAAIAGQTVRITASGSTVTVTIDNVASAPQQVSLQSALYVNFAADHIAGGDVIRLTPPGNRYKWGQLEIVPDSSTLRTVISDMDMQHYLYGLAEMPSSWASEALKVQAIAGRTFAYTRVTGFSDSDTCQCISPLTNDQAYSGFEKEDNAGGNQGSKWVAAVDGTNQQVSTYNGNAISALYSSSSGGHTEDSENVFVTALPYLRGVPDPEDGYTNPKETWRQTYTADELTAWLGADARTSVGTVQSIDTPAPFGVSGRVIKTSNGGGGVRITGSSGTKQVNGDVFRSVVNAGAPSARELFSTLFRVSNPETAVPPTPSGFVPVAPERILDTRIGNGAPTAKVGAGSTIDVQITGRGGVPTAGVTGVVLNVTAVGASTSSFVTVSPSGVARPNASNLNTRTGRISSDLVVTQVSRLGRVAFYNHLGSVDLVADVAGYLVDPGSAVGSTFHPLAPARTLDTRTAVGGSARLGADQTIDLQVTGAGGVPASGVSAVVVNLTAVAPTADSFVTAWPAGGARPGVSNLNTAPGRTTPNLAVVPVGAGGRISLYNLTGSVDLLADVAGWYSDSGGGRTVGVPPVRILDTRSGLGSPTRLGALTTVELVVAARGGVPANATAVILTVTAVSPSAASFVTAWPAGQPRPNASNLNTEPGIDAPALVEVPIGADGKIWLYNHQGSVDLLADVAGYVIPADA